MPAHERYQDQANYRRNRVNAINNGRRFALLKIMLSQSYQTTSDCRPGHRRKMKTPAAPGDGFGKILTRNEVWQKGRTGRPKKRARCSGSKQAKVDPEDRRVE